MSVDCQSLVVPVANKTLCVIDIDCTLTARVMFPCITEVGVDVGTIVGVAVDLDSEGVGVGAAVGFPTVPQTCDETSEASKQQQSRMSLG